MKHQHVMIGIFLAIIVLSLTYNHTTTEGFNSLTESACESHCEDKCSGGDSPPQPPTPTGGGGGAGKCSGSENYCSGITNEAQCVGFSECSWSGGGAGGGAGKCSGSPYYCSMIHNEELCRSYSDCTWGGDNPKSKPSTSISYNCNSSNGSCTQVIGTGGTYPDINTCYASCKKPKPNPKGDSTYSCINGRCKKGTGTQSLADCSAACKPSGGKGGNSKLPAEIIGYYHFTWGTGSTGPSGANIGVTFSGWMPGSSQGDVPPNTQNKDNFISYGGGNANGSWNSSNLSLLTTKNQLDKIKSLGYSGVCFDVENGTGTVSDFNNAFMAVKNAGLTVMVTTSHFAPYGFQNKDELGRDWIKNPNIDIYSPQLYTTGAEASNLWINTGGSSISWKDMLQCVPKLAPSIVDDSMYADVKSKLPNAVGFFQWKQV